MTATSRSVPRARTLVVTCATALLGAGVLAGCGSDSGATSSGPASATTSTSTSTTGPASASPAAALTLQDAWVKASANPGGMTAVFGVLRNTGTTAVTVTSAASPVARSVELHEVAMVDGAMKMRPKAGGFVVPAGGTHELAPGGDHIMLMGLAGPVLPGQSVTVTLTTSTGSAVEVTGIAKQYAGGNEHYAPSGGAGMPSGGAGTASGGTSPAASSTS